MQDPRKEALYTINISTIPRDGFLVPSGHGNLLPNSTTYQERRGLADAKSL